MSGARRTRAGDFCAWGSGWPLRADGGNVVLLKHASNVPQRALAIEDIIRRAGFPDGAFQTLMISSDQVERILDDARVAGASLTGSERAGRQVAAAGRQIKKTVLELGGSNPFIVMPSADMRAAIDRGQGASLSRPMRCACLTSDSGAYSFRFRTTAEQPGIAVGALGTHRCWPAGLRRTDAVPHVRNVRA